MAPEFGPQQVLGQVIWRLENARKPFSGRGSARTPLVGGLTALPDPNWWGGHGCLLPKNRTPALGPLGLGLRSIGLRP